MSLHLSKLVLMVNRQIDGGRRWSRRLLVISQTYILSKLHLYIVTNWTTNVQIECDIDLHKHQIHYCFCQTQGLYYNSTAATVSSLEVLGVDLLRAFPNLIITSHKFKT
jgi:hypothetical protein